MEKEYIALDVCDTDSDSRMPKSNAGTQHATQTSSHIPSCESTFFLRDLELWKVWRPITLSLKCLGLMWRNPERDSATGRPDLHTVHCCFMLILTWFFALHFFLVYDTDDTFGIELFQKLACNIYAIQAACGISTFIYVNHNHVPTFLHEWEKYKIKHGGVPMKTLTKCVFHRVAFVNITLTVIGVITIIAMSFLPQNKVGLIIPLEKFIPPNHFQWFLLLFLIVYIYVVIAWIQTIVIANGICHLFALEFKILAKEYSTVTKENSQNNCEITQSTSLYEFSTPKKQKNFTCYETEKFRQRHLDLRILVSRLDDIMHVYLLFLYLFAIPLIVLLLYGIGGYDSSQQTDMMFSIVTMVSIVGALTIFVSFITWTSYSGTCLASAVSLLKFLMHLTNFFIKYTFQETGYYLFQSRWKHFVVNRKQNTSLSH